MVSYCYTSSWGKWEGGTEITISLYLFLCVGKIKLFTQKTLCNVFSGTESVTFREKLYFFSYELSKWSRKGRSHFRAPVQSLHMSLSQSMQLCNPWQFGSFICLLCNLITIAMTSSVPWNYCLITPVTCFCWARSSLNMTVLPEALNKIRPQSMCVLQVLAGTVHNTGEGKDAATDVCLYYCE